MLILGKIIKSNSHTDYICQVYGPGEVETPPAREDYAFGTFVRVELDGGRWLVGLIYDTVLFNPDFGRLGPRLSPEEDLAVFSPDYLAEKATLIGITAVGRMDADAQAVQGVPSIAASADALVEQMTDEQVRTFHQSSSVPQIAYAPLLLEQDSPLALPLLRAVITKLITLFPEHADLLSVMEEDLAWKGQVGPLGGTR